MEELRELFEQGYEFIASSYYGDMALESWEDIEDDYHSDDDDEWCYMEVSIDHEARRVEFFHGCEE